MIKHGRLRIGKHIETDVFSLAIGFSLLLCADGALLCSMFISALLHEIGHLLFFAFWHVPIATFHIGVFGADITARGLLSYRRDMWMFLGGCLMNFLTAAICTIVYLYTQRGELLIYCSLLYGIFNLLPQRALDGGRALYAYPAMHHDLSVARRRALIWSLATTCLLWVIGAALFLFAAFRDRAATPAAYSMFFLSLFFLRMLLKYDDL